MFLVFSNSIRIVLEPIMVAKCCKNKNSYDMKICFHLIKIILYLIKHIFIISPFSSWYQNIFSFSQNNLRSVRNIFTIYTFFHSSKIYFYFMNFLLNTFLVSISGLPFAFAKIRILLSVCKLNNSTMMWILNKHIAFS